MTVLVLSGNNKDTQSFITQEGLGSSVRHVVNKESIPSGITILTIHVLPSYYDRRDYHAVQENVTRVIRRCHDVQVLDYVLVEDEWVQRDLDVGVTEPAPEPKQKPKAKEPAGNSTGPEVHFEPGFNESVEEPELPDKENYFEADEDASAEADEFLAFLNGDD